MVGDGEFVEQSVQGERLWNALRYGSVVTTEQRYGAHIRLFPEFSGDPIRYRTHIDAGFYNDVAPDGTEQDTSLTHGRQENSVTIITG
jgi:hypothetical protein